MSSEPVRFSRLKLFGKSPAHYAAASVTETPSMELGTAVDRLVFGTGAVLAYPGATRRGKEFDAFVEANPGALIVTRTVGDQAMRMAEAVLSVPDAVRVLSGRRQERIVWTMDGRDCAGTPDAFSFDDRRVGDLKTSETVDPRFFPFKVRRFAYHAQLAWYRHGLLRMGAPAIDDVFIVALESSAPYVVTVYKLTERTIEMGDRLWRLWWEQLAVCEASDSFPPYVQAIADLDLPFDEDIDLSDAGEAVEAVETTA